MTSRRRFLRESAFAAAGAALLPSFGRPGFGLQEPDYLSFDLHSHPGAFFNRERKEYPGDEAVLKTVTAMNEGRLSGRDTKNNSARSEP